MTLSMDQLLPPSLRLAPADVYRHATLVVYSVALSAITVLLILLLLCWLDFESTAMNAAWLLPLQALPLMVLWLTSSPVLAGHAFMTLLLGAIVWDFGPDNGHGVMGVMAFAVTSWAFTGRFGGAIWTGVGVVWAGLLGPFVFRADDYSLTLSVTTAVITFAAGIAAGVNEITRIRALEAANQALHELQQQRDSMRTFVEVAFSAWIETRGGEIRRISDAALRLIGSSSEPLTGRRLRELVHPDDWPRSLQLFREAPAHGSHGNAYPSGRRPVALD